ncbi:asparaginase domain-containing protein [Microaceticoccus formicicus]|uniref:asparaginase domain-containing protein n=1 Tax=Microaceticoccus formicicus TaxID=3118105 RepID=UPI003CD00FF7|nr:asparaginase domain-containing protein [Peptoniphilaceae bacterium AMB_02]
MKEILVIETGGTFATGAMGEIRSLNAVNEKKVYDYEIVATRIKKYNHSLTVERPMYTLSENMTIENLNSLLDFLYTVNFSKYDGVVLIHGTDTLAFTANLLSMIFGNCGVPIVMVSSNHPLSNPMANGISNFLAALDFIEKVGTKGVYVVYRNHSDVMQVHLGSRVKQMNQVIDAYESFKNINFGVIADSEFYINSSSLNPKIEEINANEFKYDKKIKMDSRVVLIHPYVGLRYDYFKIDEKVDAIVCGVYHSGTVNSQDVYIDQSINALIEKAEEYDIPIFIGELTSGVERYESIEKIKDSSVVFPAYDISLENLYMKVHVGLSLTNDNLDLFDYVNCENVFFEKIKETK